MISKKSSLWLDYSDYRYEGGNLLQIIKKQAKKQRKIQLEQEHIKFSKSAWSTRDILYNQIIIVTNTKRMTYLKQTNLNTSNVDQIKPSLIHKSTDTLKNTRDKYTKKIQK